MDELMEDNFGSPGARDYLAVLTARLVATIREVLADAERLDPDEDGESLFMPSIDVLALLCERYDAEPPRPATVKQWHTRYVAAFNAGIDRMKLTAEFKTARRRVIDNTFRWLLGLAETYHGE
jgi:hypothetical protein